MNHVAYVEWYTDFDPNDGAEFEEFDHHLKVYSGRMYADGYCGLLDLELDNNGIPEGWVDELKKYPSGFYELHYDSYTDHEYCDGYIAYSYEVACEILSMKKSWKAWEDHCWSDHRGRRCSILLNDTQSVFQRRAVIPATIDHRSHMDRVRPSGVRWCRLHSEG